MKWAFLAVGAALAMVAVLANPASVEAAPKGGGCEVTVQQQRGSRILGNLAEGALNYGANKAGVRLDYSTRRDLRMFLSDGIACSLTAGEQVKARKAEEASLESGRTGQGSARSWKSEDRRGVSGQSQVEERTGSGDNECAVTRTMVTDVDGAEKSVRIRRCRLADGGWDNGKVLT